MFRKFLFSTLLILAITSCNTETVFKEVKVNDRYSISVPEYLQPCVDLHKDASFQYQNNEKDMYAIVIDERKKTMAKYDLDYDIALYYKVATQPFSEAKNGIVGVPVKEKIDGHDALVSEIKGNLEGIDVYYNIGVIETPFAFYQILTWTRADNKDKYEGDMTRMIESFKELPQPDSELPQPRVPEDTVKTAS